MVLKRSTLPGYIYPTSVLTDKHVHVMSLGSILVFQSKAYIVAEAKNKNNLCEDCAMAYETKESEDLSNSNCRCKLGDCDYLCKTDRNSNYQLLSKDNISKDFIEGL